MIVRDELSSTLRVVLLKEKSTGHGGYGSGRTSRCTSCSARMVSVDFVDFTETFVERYTDTQPTLRTPKVNLLRVSCDYPKLSHRTKTYIIHGPGLVSEPPVFRITSVKSNWTFSLNFKGLTFLPIRLRHNWRVGSDYRKDVIRSTRSPGGTFKPPLKSEYRYFSYKPIVTRGSIPWWIVSLIIR